MEVEAVVALLGQNQFDLIRVEAAVIGLLQQAADSGCDALLHGVALAVGELPRHQHVAVRVEQLIGLIERDGGGVVLLLAAI